MQTLIERLRTDFGKKTLGELIQDREAAAVEIERLTREMSRSCTLQSNQRERRDPPVAAARHVVETPKDSRLLLRLRDVCEMVGLSRSTIYLGMKAGSFPRAIPIGARSVRWKASEVAEWLNEKYCKTR